MSGFTDLRPASGGGALDVVGGGFTDSATVTIGGISGADATVLDPTFLSLSTPPLSPGTLNDVSVTVPDPGLGTATATRPNAFFADFLDVPRTISSTPSSRRSSATASRLAAGDYCPQDSVTRAQMAVFLPAAEHGSLFTPLPCTGVFADVACSPEPAFAFDWIEQLAEGITGGCGGGNSCPDNPNTRRQMAVFLVSLSRQDVRNVGSQSLGISMLQ